MSIKTSGLYFTMWCAEGKATRRPLPVRALALRFALVGWIKNNHFGFKLAAARRRGLTLALGGEAQLSDGKRKRVGVDGG